MPTSAPMQLTATQLNALDKTEVSSVKLPPQYRDVGRIATLQFEWEGAQYTCRKVIAGSSYYVDNDNDGLIECTPV